MSMIGRTVLITGANTGIGRATAASLAAQGATLFLAGRSEARHREVLEDVARAGGAATFLPLDLGDLASVRACAERFLATGSPLHVLLNNAGLASSRGVTRDGFERTFGVNHLGHYLLTELLLDRLIAGSTSSSSGPSRIVNVASVAHYKVTHIDWDALRRPTRSLSGVPEYGVSKLCNVLHAKALAKRLQGTGVTTYALHPGVIASDVWRGVPWGARQLIRLFMKSTEEGAATSLYCVTSDEVAEASGRYYDECKERRPSQLADNPALAAELDARSRQWVAAFL